MIIIIIICGSLPVVVVATILRFDSPKMKNQKKHKAFAEQPSEHNSRRLLCWLKMTGVRASPSVNQERATAIPFHMAVVFISQRGGERERESPRNNSAPLAMTSVTASATETKTAQKWIMSSSHRGIPAAEGGSESEPHTGSSSSTWWWQLPSAPTCPHMPFQHALRTRCHAVPDSKHKTQVNAHTNTLGDELGQLQYGGESEERKWAKSNYLFQ